MALMAALLLIACGEGTTKQSDKARQLIDAAYKAKDYAQLIQLADSLEQIGELPQADAYYWRGYASDRLKQKRMAEFYWKTSLQAAGDVTDKQAAATYAKSASRLANLLCVRGDYDGTLKIALPAVERLQALGCDSTSDYVNLLIYIGCCQSTVGDQSGADTEDGFQLAYKKHLENIERDHSEDAYKNAIAGLINMAYYCNVTENYSNAIDWIDQFGKLLSQYEQRPDANTAYIDKQLARFDIYKAIALEGLGKKEDAAQVYDSFLTTGFSKTPEGRINANDYLIAAGRWDEAADNYRSLNELLGQQQTSMTIDDIQNLLLKKYRANVLAGRKDTALAVSQMVCDSLEKAISQAAKTEKEELSTIAARSEQFAQQQEASQRKHQLALMGLTLLAFLLIIGYAVWCRLAVRRRKNEYDQLQAAYTELEESTSEKASAATAQRIASDIKLAITPQSLPVHRAIKTYASQTNIKDTTGNLYDLLIRDDKLYLMQADAKSNNVRSSVLMALARAQFRTASALETAPDRIVAVVNEALAATDGSGNEVMLFVGVLDLATGNLQYCNAGHTSPLVVTPEVSLLPAGLNPPVGLEASASYEAQEITLPAGALIMLYNDGVVLMENAEGKPFGERRLLGDALQASKLDPAPEPFVSYIVNSVKTYMGDAEPVDNVAMVAIRYK